MKTSITPETRCCGRVTPKGMGPAFHRQCNRKGAVKVGDKLYCQSHIPGQKLTRAVDPHKESLKRQMYLLGLQAKARARAAK